MKINKQLQKTVRQLITASFSEGKMLESQIVKSIKILKLLPKDEAILSLSEYLKGLRRTEKEHTMYIESVAPLSSAQIKKAKQIVEKKTRITKVLVNINPEILGGFKLQVGDEIWDESILGKVDQLKEAING